MFVKANVVATVLALAAVALAQCANGAPKCCQTLQDNQVAGLVDAVSSVAQGAIVPDVSRTDLESLAHSFAYACTSSSDGACTASSVCCQFSAFGGLAAFGCTKA